LTGIFIHIQLDPTDNKEDQFEVMVSLDGKRDVFQATRLLKFKIAHVDYHRGKLIGKGAYGKVYEGLNKAVGFE
jgi:hypothetical protein